MATSYQNFVRNENGNRLNISEILKSVQSCNEMKYSSYRMASKIKILQKALHTDILTLAVIAAVFEQHRVTEILLTIEIAGLEALLSDIFFACNKLGEHCIDVEACVCLTLQLLLKIFHVKVDGMFQVLSIKLMLCILSSSSFEEKCHFMFCHTADHNQSVTRMKLRSMLGPLAKLGDFLGEGLWFGSHLISAVVNDCFVTWPGCLGLLESAFNNWLATDPDWFSWLRILQKFNKYDNYIHPHGCSNCKKNPIEGIAFRCCKCHDYNQCVGCFSRAVYSDMHKPTHRMQEIQTTTMQKNNKKHIKAHIQSIFNKLGCLKKSNGSVALRSSNSGHINMVTTHNEYVQTVDISDEKETEPINATSKSKLSNSINELHNSKHACALQNRMQFVIEQLEIQIREMRTRTTSNAVVANVIIEITKHFDVLESQVVTLKSIKNCMKSSVVISTPLPNTSNRTKSIGIDLLSPISINRRYHEEDIVQNDIHVENKEISGNDNEYFMTVQSYLKKHLSEEMKSKPLNNLCNYRDAEISSFHFGDTTDETYSSSTISEDEEYLQKTTKVDSSVTSKADLDVLIKKLHDLLNVSANCDNTELSRSASKLESVLSNIIDSLEIDRCLQDLKISESDHPSETAGCSSQT